MCPFFRHEVVQSQPQSLFIWHDGTTWRLYYGMPTRALWTPEEQEFSRGWRSAYLVQDAFPDPALISG